MLSPCSESKKKRKRLEKQTLTLTTTTDDDDINDEAKQNTKDEEIASNHGLSSNPLMLQDPHSVRSPALDNAPLKKSLFGKDQVTGDKDDGSSLVGLPGIPLLPHSQQSTTDGVYFILEKASLVAAYVGKKYQILNPDEHGSFLRRKNLNPYDFRPDIVYEALHEIMNSRLRMAGRLRAVFIRTDEGILIKIEPQTHIPENFKSFCNMMAELLQKFSIKSKNKQGKLLRLIKNPVTQHLPINSLKIGLSVSSSKSVRLTDYSVANFGKNIGKNLVFVVGAMAHGKIDADYIDDLISVSAYPLSAATCLRRICLALERNWKIL